MSTLEQEQSVIRKDKHYILRTDPNKYMPDPNQWTLDEVNKLVYTWKPSYEMWPFRWGVGLLGLAGSASATYVNWYFRDTLYLLNTAKISSYAAMFILPGFAAATLHLFLVSNKILSDDKKTCSVCVQVRGMGIQAATSIIYPLILVPAVCYPIAKHLKSYNVPNLTVKNPYTLLNFTREMLKPVKGQLWTMVALQVLLGMGITYAEQLAHEDLLKPHMAKRKARLSPYDQRDEEGWYEKL